MEGKGERWRRIREGFEGRSTPEALEDFRKSTIWKDIEQFFLVNLEVFREMLELDPDDRSRRYDKIRDDSHVRGMIEVTKEMPFIIDNMVEIVLQQREDKETRNADEDEDQGEEGNN